MMRIGISMESRVARSVIFSLQKHSIGISTLLTSKNKILPMVFNKMSVTDDVGKADTSELFVRGLGSIEVRLYRVKFVRETKPRKSPKKKKKKADSGPKTLRERSVYEGKEAAKLPHQAG